MQRSEALSLTGVLPSSRSGLYLLERCRVMEKDGTVVYARPAEGRKAMTFFFNVPVAATSAILLGQGSSITQAAARILSANGVMVGFTGTGGTPLFLASQDEYRPTDRLQRWIAAWIAPERRLRASLVLHDMRCRMIEASWSKHPVLGGTNAWRGAIDRFRDALAEVSTLAEAMGHEGAFTKSLYRHAADAILDARGGFRRKAGDGDGTDLANRHLDQGNYLAYGLASVALWALGVPAGLPVTHGATRAGGLVFDIADVIKDAMTLPVAFDHAAAKARQGRRAAEAANDFRDATIQALREQDALKTCFAAVDAALTAMETDPTS